jgi:UDP-glucuronate 4-epimerase
MSERGKILVTGAAGFIGMHTVLKLIHEGWDVTGIDNLNSYYSVKLKYSRLAQTGIFSKQLHDAGLVTSELFGNYRFTKASLENTPVINSLFDSERFHYVIHLGAQAGVRYSLQNPHAYIKSNVNGFLNIIENCHQYNVKHLVYASSSSVYGLSGKIPFTEDQRTDTPASLYAATKKSNELIAHSYSHLFRLPTTGLRFFTVYGPWGRPDMAMFLFTESIFNGIPIEVYGNGQMSRDFTYIDDAVDAITKVINSPSENSPLPYQIFNVGNSTPVPLLAYINEIENALDKKAIMNFKGAHPADVRNTHADIALLSERIDYRPETNIKTGVSNFVKWYLEYFQPEKAATAFASENR